MTAVLSTFYKTISTTLDAINRELSLRTIFGLNKENVEIIENDKYLIKLLFLSANTARLLQSIDIYINNLMKKNLLELWVVNYTYDPDLLVTREEMCLRIAKALRKLTFHQIDSGFRKSNLMVKESHIMDIEYEQIRD